MKHLVIGAGPVGLAYAKALKETNIPYDQVDADDNVGGNWYHGVYDTAHIISSRNITQYADYPMPADYPDFPSRQNLLDYFNNYATHFGLRENIRFSKKVVWVRPTDNNLWEVTFADGEISVYKGVLVCNGHHWSKRFPELKGNFTGEYYHSKDYKKTDQLRDKSIVVIGGGNSASDVASEAARVGKASYLSLRSGVWFLPKTMLGMPLSDWVKPWMPLWFQRLVLRFVLRIAIGKYSDYGLPEPSHRIFEKHPTLTSEVLHYIKHGRIKPKPAITHTEGKNVYFADGTSIEADAIIAATGFYVDYPFLPKELQRVQGAVVKCYGGCMLDDYKGLYLVGWSQARGGVGSLVTPGANLLAKFIGLQDEIQIPVGAVLKAMGEKLPTTHLMDPHDALRRMKRANQFWSYIQKRARQIDKKQSNFANKPLPAPQSTAIKTDLVVY